MYLSLPAANQYTAVISSFEPGADLSGSLAVKSSQPLTLTVLPNEGEGMLKQPIHGLWQPGMDGGPRDLMSNPIYVIRNN